MAIISQIGKISTGSIANVVKGPLSKLLGGKEAMNFQYPEDLMNSPSRMHAVQFRIYNVQQRKLISDDKKSISISAMTFDDVKKTVSSGYDKATSSISNLPSAASSALSSVSSSVSSLSSAIDKLGTSSKTSPMGLLGSAYDGVVNKVSSLASDGLNSVTGAFSKIAGTTSMVDALLKPEVTELKATVSLYMPDTLSVSYSAEYNEISLADATNNALRIASGVGSLAETMKNGDEAGQTVVGSLIDAANSPQVMEGITGLIDSKYDTQTKELALQASGYAVNPQMQLVFKNIGFRDFTMEFLFTPNSSSEADQVSAIINTLSAAAVPDVPSTQNGMYFIPPSIIEFDFLMGTNNASSSVVNTVTNALNKYVNLGSTIAKKLGLQSSSVNERLFKFGRCVITNLAVDYAPNGWAAYENGAPLQTRLTLSLKEIEIVNKTRFAKGEVR